jgi:hypothetical protein
MPYASTVNTTGSHYFYPGVYYGASTVNRQSFTTHLSSTFTTGSMGSNPAVVLGPIDVSAYNNYTVTMVNNSANKLISGSVQVSPNGSNWGTINYVAFADLASSGIASASFTARSDKYVRAIAYPSGSGGAVTGSIDCYITMN